MKSMTRKRWFYDRKITTKVIIVFVASMVLAVSIAVGVAIMSYQNYNMNVSQEQSAYSLEALDGLLENQKSTALNYAVQISQASDVEKAMEAQDANQLDAAVKALAEYSDLDFIAVTNTAGTVLLDTMQPENKGQDLSGKRSSNRL